jgi:O-antigen ligase
MKKSDPPSSPAAKAALPAIDWPAEWLTQIAFVLALGLALARATIGDFSRAASEPLGSDSPRGAGAAAQVGLDLLCCLPALLVLARRLSDRAYVLRGAWSAVLLAGVAAWALASGLWAADKYAALVGAAHWVAAAAMLWAAAQLVRSWLRLRMVAALALGLLLACFTHSMFHQFVDLPDTKAHWEKNKAQILADRGLANDPFLAKQFENRVLAGELMGFFVSSNSMGAVVVLLLTVSAGLGVQRILDDRSDHVGYGLLIVVPLAAWMLLKTGSRTALATPLLAGALLAVAWRTRGRLAERSKTAFWAGVGVVALGAAAVVGHGLFHGTLFHESMTFRWRYWVGAARVFAHHPVLGVGWENFGWYYPSARLAEAAEEVKDPHNFVVRFAAELGAVGLLLALAWLGRLAWEVTRPVAPTAVAVNAGAYTGPRAIRGLAAIALVALAINVACSIDFQADWGFVVFEILRRVTMFGVLLIGASVAAVRSLEAPELDGRPAPLLLYGLLVALAVFLLHNLVDFSLFEPGPLTLFAFLAGAVLGVRIPSVAGKRKRTAAVAVTLGVSVLAWMIMMGLLFTPLWSADDAAHQANFALRTRRPNEAIRLLTEARRYMPLNADYAFREAQVMMTTADAYAPEALKRLDAAIRANPMAAEYPLARARFLSRGPDARSSREQIKADYRRVLQLDPADATLRAEYADTLLGLGAPEDRAEARKQYEEALASNDRLRPEEPKRRNFENRAADIRAKLDQLKQ